MPTERYLVTVTHRGRRYRGSYHLDGDRLIVVAAQLGTRTADASLLDHTMDAAAMKLAKLVLNDLVRESVSGDDDLAVLAVQGSTTRLTICGSTTQISV